MGRYDLDTNRARHLLWQWSTHLGVDQHALALMLTVEAGADLTPLEPRHVSYQFAPPGSP